jgi:serine/threonine protein kinase
MDTSWIPIVFLFIQLLFYAVVIGVAILFARYLFSFTVLLISRVFGCIFGMIGDAVLLCLNLVGLFVYSFFAVLLLVIGRWSAANASADRFGASLASALGCLVAIKAYRPLRLFCLDRAANSLVSGLPPKFIDCRRLQNLPTEATPPRPTPSRPNSEPTGSRVARVQFGSAAFDEYTIVGSLPSGGSGARLWVAEPSDRKRRRLTGHPRRVVIKSFDLHRGSSLPSIVRESRALEAARHLGLVLEHQLEEERFWYVMPYHPGPTLTQMIEVLHHSGTGERFSGVELTSGLNYVRDLLNTLSHFHKSGLWHKDVKPDNLIVHDGAAHLVDLGLVSSLSSSLTLTTHGTEYFRDPELVRMALRGVKVHEIDGAKFDVFGAGAVLYFVLANDFPAQGGLSRFQKPVPPVLDWIVRRAMADYAKRYDSTEEMLSDLDAAYRNADIWTMLPADLPSLSGRLAPSSAAAGSLEALGASQLGQTSSPPPMVSVPPAPPLPVVPVQSGIPGTRSQSASADFGSTDRPSPILLILGFLAFISVVVFLGLVLVFSSEEGEVPINAGASWKEEARFLPGDQLALLALQNEDSASDPTILIWNPSDFSGAQAMSETLDATIRDFSNIGFSYEGVTEPEIGPLLQTELQRFSMPVTRHDGSLAPPIGVFRMTDRLGLEEFAFVEQVDGEPSITTYSVDDDEWRLSVLLPPK